MEIILESSNMQSAYKRVVSNNYRTLIKELKKRGVEHETAVTVGCSRKGVWYMTKTHWLHIALPNAYFDILGLRYPWINSA